ncbi:MAG: CvpA family protein [Deltaproteobacteria bacterium]
MNWIDFAVIGIVVAYSLIGYARGFVYSVFKVASFFVSAFLSIQAYPYVSKLLISVMHLDSTLKKMIGENLDKIITPEQLAKPNPVTGIIESWSLPKPIEEMVMNGAAVQVGQMKQSIVENISASLSIVAVNLISIIAVFAIVSFILIFARSILQGIASLPIFAQINRAGGFVFGILEGLIVIYIGFAVLTIFSSSKDMQNIFSAINTSLVAKQLYANNILILWAFGGKK